jgi:hypothetical protein
MDMKTVWNTEGKQEGTKLEIFREEIGIQNVLMQSEERW